MKREEWDRQLRFGRGPAIPLLMDLPKRLQQSDGRAAISQAVFFPFSECTKCELRIC